jgi:CubicO group peptidase (beta-lactamase class C family)
MKHAVLLTLACLAAPLAAQEATTLRVGQTVPGTLTPTSQHDYSIDLEAGMFVFGNVNQLSVDVEVTILGPDGEEIDDFDSPARGPENFTFETEAAGAHVIRVEPFDEQEGDYEVTVEVVEPVANDLEGRVDQWMRPFSGDDTPGAVVGVMDRGEIVFEKAYGMANLAFGIPHEVGTPTNIGSVTKQFTAMSILLLQNDGLLSLDDEVRTHIPELPDFGTPVTIKNLLNHTGGFREIYNFLPMAGRAGEDQIRRDEAIRVVQRQPELQAEPNTEYNYNNTGFILLSTIVERVSGMTFPEFMQERVFGPLGMTDTRVKYHQGEIIPGASTPYVPAEGGGWRSARDLAASAGAGGIYTTWHDMQKWMLNYRDMTVGGPEAIELLTTRNVLESGDTTNYALGLGVVELRGQVRYTHTGGDTAHRTFFAYFPGLEAGVFLSSNNATFSFPPARQMDDLFFGDRLEPMAEEEEPEEGTDGGMSLARMEAIVGDWILTIPGLVADFTVEDGVLHSEPRGQSRITMATPTDSTAVHEELNVSIVFHFEGERVDSATFTQGRTTPMVRFEAETSSLDVSELPGRYYSRELELWLDLQLEDDTLVVHRLRAEPMELTHRSGLTFAGAFPFAELVFQRADNGDITGLLAGNGRTKGVRFERR